MNCPPTADSHMQVYARIQQLKQTLLATTSERELALKTTTSQGTRKATLQVDTL